MSTLSFHETKNITCGEGGALLLNEDRWIERAEILREKGTDRSKFFRGQVDKYTWVDIGSSYLPSDLLAAILVAQLEDRQAIQTRRKAIWNHYHASLASWAAENEVSQPIVPNDCEHPAHLYYLLLPSLAARQLIIQHLRDNGIMSVFHYVPLHLSPMGRHYSGRTHTCEVAEHMSSRIVRLPLYTQLRDNETHDIIGKVKTFSPHQINQTHTE